MRTLILTAAVLAASIAAWAQLDLRVVASVPFAYSVAGVDAADGDCSFIINGRGGVQVRTSKETTYRMGHRDARPTPAARLVFRRYADKAVLSAIHLGTAGSVQFAPSKDEREWINLGLTARVEMVPVATRAAD